MSHNLDSNGEVRTTLTGKPIKQNHDHTTNIMYGEGGGAFGGDGFTGANLLPPGYTDKSLVRVPIRYSDLEEDEASTTDDSNNPIKPSKKKKGLFSKMHSALSTKSSSDVDFKIVMMSRGDYLKYWAKGDDGKFSSEVETPPGGRQAWFKKQLEINEQWKREDPKLEQRMVSESKESREDFEARFSAGVQPTMGAMPG